MSDCHHSSHPCCVVFENHGGARKLSPLIPGQTYGPMQDGVSLDATVDHPSALINVPQVKYD